MGSSGEVEKFVMHNLYVTTLRQAMGYKASKFPLILQLGNNFMFTDMEHLLKLGASGQEQMTLEDIQAWMQDSHNKLCLYMSAGSISKSDKAPYFGVVLDVAALQN